MVIASVNNQFVPAGKFIRCN